MTRVPSGTLEQEVEPERVRTVMLKFAARRAERIEVPSVPVAWIWVKVVSWEVRGCGCTNTDEDNVLEACHLGLTTRRITE
jgi:hypothetical protein